MTNNIQQALIEDPGNVIDGQTGGQARPGLGMAYAGRAGPTARVLGGPGRPLAH
jgi:hypothetical protein